MHGFYIEVTQGQLDKVPVEYKRRQTMKNAERYITPELKAFEDKALAARRALARAREGALRRAAGGAATRTSRACSRSPMPRPSWTRWRRSRRRAEALDLARPEFTAEEPRSTSSEGRHLVVESQVEHFIPNDTSLDALAPAPAHHRAEHGRQEHVHAAGGADRAARLLRQLRAGALGVPRPASTASSRASAPPTTSPAGARPSWWR